MENSKPSVDARVRTAFKIADAKLARLKANAAVNTPTNASPLGSAFLEVVSIIANDQTDQTHDVVKELDQSLDSAERQVQQAASKAMQLKAAVAYLKGEITALQRITDTDIKLAVIAAKSGMDAGIIDADVQLKQLDNTADEILTAEKRIRDKFLASSKSARNIMLTKAKSAAAAFINPKAAERYDRLLHRQKTNHRQKFSRIGGAL